MELVKSVIDGKTVASIELFPTFIRIRFVDDGTIEIFATNDGNLEITDNV